MGQGRTGNTINEGLAKGQDNKVISDNIGYSNYGLTNEDVKIINDDFSKKSNNKVGFFNERIKKMASGYGYGSEYNEDYSKAYIGYLNADLFKNLTPPRPEGYNVFYDEDGKSYPFYLEKYKKSSPITLWGEYANNEFLIDTHEGRGRRNALAKLGYSQVPVIFIDEKNKYNKSKHNSMRIVAQKGTSEPKVVFAENVIPINNKYLNDILEIFGEDNGADFHYSKDLELDNSLDKVLSGEIGQFLNLYLIKNSLQFATSLP